ncbi:MAG: hypothetical protein NC548_24710 [Lachnospiraceae bacterium]|nr:hypothetical protein [Lachnospiraceae bacterium]
MVSKDTVLYPGRFYILQYVSKEKEKPINTRPIVLGLGISKKHPEDFLCIDLCVIPKPIRLKFIEMFYKMFKRDIEPNIQKYWEINEADKQTYIKSLTYGELIKVKDWDILKYALKKYKIKNTKKIYSMLYCDMYKVLGNFADENMFINGTIKDVQKEFLDKIKQKRW